MRQLERLDYRIKRPISTHTRLATCEEAECEAYAHGWVSAIDETSELGQRQAHYIRMESGRAFTAERGPDGLTRFAFKAGQPCFAQHRVAVERESLFLAASSFGRVRRHTAETWVDDFATEADRLRTFVERNA